MKMKVAKRIALSLTGIAVLAGCAALGASRFDVSAYAKASFAEKGSARLDRLEQSDLQRTCSEYALKPLPDQVRARLEKQELERIRYPADGRYLGDWKQGEAIAQSGRGLQFSDAPNTMAGGNCSLPSAEQGGGFLRHDRTESVPVRKAQGNVRTDSQVHLGQDLELPRLQCLHEHAALWRCGHPQ